MLTVLARCQPSGTPENDTSAPESNIPSETTTETSGASAAAPSPTVIDAPEEPEPDLVLVNDGAGIYNGQFTESIPPAVPFWRLDPGPGGSVADAGHEKTPGLKLPGNYYYNNAIQRVTFSKPVNGRTIHLRADCYAEEPGTARMRISFSEEIRFFSAEHPGDGTWQALVIDADLPDEPFLTTADVYLSHFNQPKKSVVFDNVVLEVDTP